MMASPSNEPDSRPAVTDHRPDAQEADEVHTRLLRVALAVEESRAYWENCDAAVPPSERAIPAFEGRWFGAKSLGRTRFLLSALAERYDAFPDVLPALRRWRGMDLATRQAICHWHVQLSDPLYRRFTGRFLLDRRSAHDAKVDRDIVLRWMKSEFPNRWSEATSVQFASKLLSAASEAGLVTPKRDPRGLLFPKVTDLALAYLLYVLQGVRFEGTLTSNPYLASVGLEGGLLDQRLRALPGVTFRRMSHLTEFDWAYPDLRSWAEASL